MKLGPHIINSTAPAIQWASKAPIVKCLDKTQPFNSAPRGAYRIFRHFFLHQNVDDPSGTVSEILVALRGYRHPLLYVELWNEEHPTENQLKPVVSLLHAAGLKVIGGSWSTGSITKADWDAAACCDARCGHHYWGKEGFTHDNALQFLNFWKAGDGPYFITECGRDAVEGGQAGWKNCDLTEQQYVNELFAYEAELQKYDFVFGATPFTAGPTPDWAAFDTDELVQYILQEKMMALQDQFPDLYKQWVAAGGIDNNFRKHCLGVGAIKPTKDDVEFLADELQSDVTQIKNAVDNLPLT